jgi:transcriptional regulator with XRE-family HTH domain
MSLHKTDLGTYLRTAREREGYSLRDVERKVGIANAYLSQIESGKIRRPSPLVLHKLSRLFGVSYTTLMRLAGYPAPEEKQDDTTLALARRFGPVTENEAEAVMEYLQFLRSRRGPRK